MTGCKRQREKNLRRMYCNKGIMDPQNGACRARGTELAGLYRHLREKRGEVLALRDNLVGRLPSWLTTDLGT
jgi:hypothetical protein